MNPLRRYLATHRPQPHYPWYDTSPEERRAWLEAHCHPPRVAPSPSMAESRLPVKPDPHLQQLALALAPPCPDLSVPQAPYLSMHTLT